MIRLIACHLQNESLHCEIKDLTAEFEFERVDYLDSIRKLEKELAWKDEVLRRIHPTLRRDCNFANLDKIRVRSPQTMTLIN